MYHNARQGSAACLRWVACRGVSASRLAACRRFCCLLLFLASQLPGLAALQVVLAYSGGLDTSVILKWLQEAYDCEVRAVLRCGLLPRAVVKAAAAACLCCRMPACALGSRLCCCLHSHVRMSWHRALSRWLAQRTCRRVGFIPSVFHHMSPSADQHSVLLLLSRRW